MSGKNSHIYFFYFWFKNKRVRKKWKNSKNLNLGQYFNAKRNTWEIITPWKVVFLAVNMFAIKFSTALCIADMQDFPNSAMLNLLKIQFFILKRMRFRNSMHILEGWYSIYSILNCGFKLLFDLCAPFYVTTILDLYSWCILIIYHHICFEISWVRNKWMRIKYLIIMV